MTASSFQGLQHFAHIVKQVREMGSIRIFGKWSGSEDWVQGSVSRFA